MSIQHQSYFELKKDRGEEFAIRAVLYNLKSLKSNARAAARAMNSSPDTLYLAIEKREERISKTLLNKPRV